MDIRQITPRFFVAPQIDPADMPALAGAGFSVVIDNRPDNEIPPELQAPAMEAAAREAGLEFVANPLTNETMTPERLMLQRETLAAARGKVLAYCRSGTRSTIAWALGHAPDLPADDILSAAAQGGYDLEGLRPLIESLKRG